MQRAPEDETREQASSGAPLPIHRGDPGDENDYREGGAWFRIWAPDPNGSERQA